MKPIVLAAVCLVLQGRAQAQRPGSLEAVLDFYSGLTGKTVLRSGVLPNLPEPVAEKLPSETNAAIGFIESRLREQGIEISQDGPLFVRVVPVGWTNSPAAAFLATLKPPRDNGDSLKGTILFAPADLDQVLSLYSRLRSRTILRSRLGARALSLKTRGDMTSDQAAYGIAVMFALNGIAAVDDGEKFVQLVPINRWREVVAASPKTSPDAQVLDPTELPVFKLEPPHPSMNRLSRIYLRILGQQPPWTPRPVDKLAEFYAELTNQKAVASPSQGRMPVLFEITTPLTREELLYAIQTTLNLEGLAIASTGDQQISVMSLGEKRRRESEKKLSSER